LKIILNRKNKEAYWCKHLGSIDVYHEFSEKFRYLSQCQLPLYICITFVYRIEGSTSSINKCEYLSGETFYWAECFRTCYV